MKRAIVRPSRREVTGMLAAAALLPAAVVAVAGRIARAELTTAAAEARVNALANEVWANFGRTDLDSAQRIDALVALLVANTDVMLLGRLVLARSWQQLDDAQKDRYQALFTEVVMRTFARRLDQFAKDASGSIEDHFSVLSSAPAGTRDVLVRSRVRPQSGNSLAVDWRLRDSGDGPVIIDLIIEGVSLLVSQRSEFAAVIERSGIDGLLDELQARAESTRS